MPLRMERIRHLFARHVPWRSLIGMGIGAVIAGPLCLLLHEAVLSVRAGVAFGSVALRESESVWQLMILASRYGALAYLPVMWAHTVVTGLLAQRGRDGFAWSALSGGMLSIPVAAFMTWSTQSAIFQRFGWVSLPSLVWMYLPFVATGLVIGLLYWRIAVWPLRRWRRQVESSKAAIRAME